MKKKLCLEDVLSVMSEPVMSDVNVTFLDLDCACIVVPKGSDWHCLIPGCALELPVVSWFAVPDGVYFCVCSKEEMRRGRY